MTMCEFCKPIFETPSDEYNKAAISSKKVITIGDSDIDIELALEIGDFGEAKERTVNFVAALSSKRLINDALIDAAILRKKINFCPFCGCKLDVKAP